MYKEIKILTSYTLGICQLLNSCWHFGETSSDNGQHQFPPWNNFDISFFGNTFSNSNCVNKCLYHSLFGLYQLKPQFNGQKTETWVWAKVFFAVHVVTCLNQYIPRIILSQTGNTSFQLFCFPLICSVIIIMLNTPIVYHSDKTKAQLIGSCPKQWNLLKKGVILSS